MNTEAKQSLRIRIKGIAFFCVSILAVYGVSCWASQILGLNIFANDHYLIGFMCLEMILIISMIAFLFSPNVFLSVVARIANKQIEEQTGCQDVIPELSQNESTIRTVMRTVEAPEKIACNDKGVAQLLKYMQRIDKTVKTPKDFLEKALQKDFARKYLNDIAVLISTSSLDEKSTLALRFLYAVIYDISDDHLVSKEDSKAKIENMRLLLSKLSSIGGSNESATTLYKMIFGIMRNAFRQEDYKSVVEAYALTCGSHLKDAAVRSELKSYMYEMVGTSKLFLKDKSAIPYLKLALSCNPNNWLALLCLSEYYYERHDYVNVYEYAGRCFALLPERGPGEKELAKIGDILSSMMYMSAFALGKFDEAYATVSAVDERVGNDASVKGNRAYLAFKCEKYDEAEQCMKQAWELDPNQGSVLNVRGMLFLRKGMYSKAVKAFKDASKYFKPGKDNSLERFFYGEICNNLAVALYKNSEKEAARGWFDKAIAVCYPDVSVNILDALPPISCPDGKR